MQESNWEGQLKGDWENTILPHAEKLGAKTIGTIGELQEVFIVTNTELFILHYK